MDDYVKLESIEKLFFLLSIHALLQPQSNKLLISFQSLVVLYDTFNIIFWEKTSIPYKKQLYLIDVQIEWLVSKWKTTLVWNELSSSSSCDGAMHEIFLNHKFQWPQEGLNSEFIAYEVVT